MSRKAKRSAQELRRPARSKSTSGWSWPWRMMRAMSDAAFPSSLEANDSMAARISSEVRIDETSE